MAEVLEAEPQFLSGPPRYRLFCGTWSTFKDKSGLASLPQTQANATALADALGSIGALSGEPKLVHDAPGGACLSALEEFVAEPGDAVIYFASHGLVPSGASQFFRLATGETEGMDDMMRAFMFSEALERLTARGSGRKLVVIDACYSGKAATSLLGHSGVDLHLPQDICVLFATDPFTAASAPDEQKLTAFTGSLAALLRSGLPGRGPQLSVRAIYGYFESSAKGLNIPAPWLITTGNAAEMVTFRNAESDGARDGGYGELVAAFDHRTEILYVDDEENLRASFRTELERAGHRVTLADGPLQGKQALQSGHFDIVVIDLLLQGEAPAIDFIQHCNRVAADSLLLLVSRRSKAVEEDEEGQGQSRAERWDRLNAIFSYPSNIRAFLWKPNYLKKVLHHADRIRKARRHTLGHVHGLEAGVALISERMLDRDDTLGDRNERLQLEIRVCIERLVERWFPMRDEDDDEPVYIRSMAMRPVTGGRSASTVFTLVPELNGIDAQSVAPLVLKVGPRAAVEQEVRRYDRYVQVGVPLDVRTDKLDAVMIGDVGGAIYSFRGSDDHAIVEASQLPPAEIRTCFDAMFGEQASKRWYGSEGTGSGVSAIDHFEHLAYPDERFTAAYDQLVRSLQKTCKGLAADHFARLEAEAIKPKYEDMGRTHTATLVHGDLTLDNIVKISDDRFALIDYMTVGLGPRLIDFVTLEVACWMLARCPDTPRGERFADAHAAVPRSLRETEPGTPVAAWLQDARALAVQCRELAVFNHRDATDDEYGELLWLAAVRASEFKSRGITTEERTAQRALLPALAIAAQAMIG